LKEVERRKDKGKIEVKSNINAKGAKTKTKTVHVGKHIFFGGNMVLVFGPI
jgi:hypothetical protein